MTLHAQLLVALIGALLTVPILAERTKLKPAFNIFRVSQDVELGRQVSKQFETQSEILRSAEAVNYVGLLGNRLASKAPDSGQFRFQYAIVNDKSINAVGLPGGFLYLNRGTIEAAANEAQFALVLAHEIAHVVLRHGTNQISKAYALQVPASALGAAGRTSISSVLAKIEGGFTASSLLLKNTAESETEADLLGVQILYDADYDPAEGARFFGNLQGQTDGKTPSLSGHPDPVNRLGNLTKEIDKLGSTRPDAILDSAEFQKFRQLVTKFPEPRTTALQ
jgi:predicted Zn-dependent protease